MDVVRYDERWGWLRSKARACTRSKVSQVQDTGLVPFRNVPDTSEPQSASGWHSQSKYGSRELPEGLYTSASQREDTEILGTANHNSALRALGRIYSPKIESLGRGRHARRLESYVFALPESIRHLRLSRRHQHLLPRPSLLLHSSFFSFVSPLCSPHLCYPHLTLTSPVAPSLIHSLSGSTPLPSIHLPINLSLL